VYSNLKQTVGETVGETVRGTPAQIIEQIQSNPAITRERLSKILGLSIRGIEYHLKKIKRG